MIAAPTVCAPIAATIHAAWFGAQIADAIAPADAGRKEARGRLDTCRLQAAETESKRAVLDGGCIPMTAGRAGQDPGDG